ncbi:MATE family efflux transporter [Fibrobacter succinogenes]|uniref:Membrane protein involved in the export of O-antigen and teichoic acid n=1 Tax=Fibrobacter succinogenes TaxID=833 RepID=A0A380RUJ5_FIBSU|nr:polysaccharide biosynthesis C-terminal domain-containing protein [Fibrobacter succinogenes]PWJ37005.1 O-antigen/teichoic acid export membrane protein [Fibrobacter succinogenes subsp. elongatus]SUQ19253.1 Membrane protein involved in the export of O-antigen and teichoic acid [Fibrobacter succinogenes]
MFATIKKHKTIIIRLMVALMSFIDTIFLNRCLGTSGKGEYSVIINYATVIQLVICFGIAMSYGSFYRKGLKKIEETYNTLLLLQSSIYCFLAFFVALIPIPVQIKCIVILAVTITSESQYDALALFHDISKRNIILFTCEFSYLLTLAICFFTDIHNLYVILAALMLRYVIRLIVYICKFKFFVVNLKGFDFTVVPKIIKIGVQITIISLLMQLNYNLDVIMMDRLGVKSDEIGIYSVAAQFACMVWIVPDAFKELIFNRTKKDDSPLLIKKALLLNITINIAIILCFFCLGDFFIKLAYGEVFVESYTLTLILLIGCIPMVIYKIIHPLYISKQKNNIVITILSISVCMNMFANFIFIPLMGAKGAALSSVISYSICGFVFLFKYLVDCKKRSTL